MYKPSKTHQRKIGNTVEGHGEYATYWPEYEYKCPDCGKWTQDTSDVSIEMPDGEAFLCSSCAAEGSCNATVPPAAISLQTQPIPCARPGFLASGKGVSGEHPHA